MVMSAEQPLGQPPVNKKKDITPAGVQADALAAMPSPTPAPSPTPHPGQSFIDDLAKRGLYDPKGDAFQGLGAASALNAEMMKQGGRAKAAPWLLDMIAAQKGGTPIMKTKMGKERFWDGKTWQTREVQQP